MTDTNAKHEQLAALIDELTAAYMPASRRASGNAYGTLLEAIEIPLLRAVMTRVRYNQSRAARALGISRGTLRSKLQKHFNDEFIGTREEA